MYLRTVIAASVVGLLIACSAGPADAQQIYKWTDASGVIHFSQTPPATGTHYTHVQLASQPPAASTPAATATDGSHADTPPPLVPVTHAATSQPDTTGNRAQLCRQLATNITLLEGQTPVVTTTDNGAQQVMGGSARQQQLATARAQQTQYCSLGGG